MEATQGLHGDGGAEAVHGLCGDGDMEAAQGLRGRLMNVGIFAHRRVVATGTEARRWRGWQLLLVVVASRAAAMLLRWHGRSHWRLN
jgi:hypothetical protein